MSFKVDPSSGCVLDALGLLVDFLLHVVAVVAQPQLLDLQLNRLDFSTRRATLM
jgi:hypothetical protein